MKLSGNAILIAIFIGIIIGALFGGALPQYAVQIKFIGDMFLRALMMMVIPLIVASMIVGISNLGDVRHLGAIGRRTIIYYLATTGLSVLLGIVLVNITRPGVGVERGETLPQQRYTTSGQTLILEDDARFRRTYDERYKIELTDQNIYGVVDAMTTTKVTVTEWLDAKFQQPTVPNATGVGIKIDLVVAARVKGKEARSVFNAIIDMLVGLIPKNLFSAMVEMQVLPLIVFSLIFGGVLTTLGDKGKPVIVFFDGLNDAIMKIIHLIMVCAPVGIFALVAARLGQAGGFIGFWPELVKLAKYAMTVIVGLLIHGFITLPLILRFVGKRNFFNYSSNMLPALTTAFSTASSSATLPVTIECTEENNKISNRTASFVLPLGATINMDGTALYEAVAAIFIAQTYGISLGPVQQAVIFLTATLAAIGAAGIPEAGLVTMVIVLNAVGLPIEGISLILVIDWFLDRCRTTVNVWGDAVGAAVVEQLEASES
ncbi:TPA: dicarboxylate/amino acid:cation symporter [Candidatus Poribacteria bacterium]|nr:dicarboxylate/amino acid:cation symporter [Candidatus Poribacteria bacterium]